MLVFVCLLRSIQYTKFWKFILLASSSNTFMWQMSFYPSNVDEDASLLACRLLSTDKGLTIFRRRTALSCSGLKQYTQSKLLESEDKSTTLVQSMLDHLRMDMAQHSRRNLNPKHFCFNICRPATVEHGNPSVLMLQSLGRTTSHTYSPKFLNVRPSITLRQIQSATPSVTDHTNSALSFATAWLIMKTDNRIFCIDYSNVSQVSI